MKNSYCTLLINFIINLIRSIIYGWIDQHNSLKTFGSILVMTSVIVKMF